ncbi:MAG TPA: putative colanic acid biosynthesis acetyltransferase, partial [Ochrobactrum intermedium]|nr:putative colanic acid biosynthesis acetyltransferase [Brucella intermedia]
MVIMTVTSNHNALGEGIRGRMNASRPLEGGATFTLGHRVQRL